MNSRGYWYVLMTAFVLVLLGRRRMLNAVGQSM